MEKWEWNWKTGILMVACCVVAGVFADIIYEKTIVTIIINSVGVMIGSAFAVFLLWCWQEKKRMKDA